MRYFNEADKKKKTARINTQENPDNLSPQNLSQLEITVKASLKDGYLPCPAAWKIAEDAGVTKSAIGDIVDRLGIRITDCQVGCFRVDKTPFGNSMQKDMDDELIAVLETYKTGKRIDCSEIFVLAGRFEVKPMAVASEASARGLKILGCQLGCF